MKIEFNNLGIIDCGIMNVAENTINIKYGINGAGKSTISKGIDRYINKDDLNDLKKFGSDVMPDIKIDNNIDNVIIFNQDYVNKYLFHEDLLNNSFEILINTEEYRIAIKRINDLFIELINAINESNITAIIDDLIRFRDSIKFKETQTDNGTKYSILGTSKLIKGRKLADISSVLKESIIPYKTRLEADDNHEWLSWFNSGIKFISDKACPFCLKELPHNFENIRSDIDNTFNKTALKQNVEVRKIVSEFSKYLDNEDKILMSQIIKSNESLREHEIDFLHSVYETCGSELTKLQVLKSLDVIKIKKIFEEGKLISFLEDNKLLVPFYDTLNNEAVKAIKRVNESIEKLIFKSSEIDEVTKEFAKDLNSSILNKTKYINDLFIISGIPYKIEIQSIGNESFKTVLKPIQEDKIITENSLSYGEKNAISLILFSLEAEKKYDLIILDDPVSSFDNNKKYALLHYLFSKENAIFKEKTVILFTHDFNIIIDLIFKNEFKNIRNNCYFVTNENGVFIEKKINRDKIQNTCRQWLKKAKDPQCNILIRIVNLRKYIQYTNPSENNIWDVLSSIEHLYPKPISLNDKKEKEIMEPGEIEKGINGIRRFITDFNYDNILREINTDNLLFWYNDSKSSLDKLQILRVYLYKNNKNLVNNVFMNYITESYHIEANEMMSLNEKSFNLIPNYVMNICDSIMEKNKVESVKKVKVNA